MQMLRKYGLEDANPVSTPMIRNALTIFDDDTTGEVNPPPWPYSQLMGELLWIGTVLRVDITFAVNVLARYSQKPMQVDWDAVKRVLWYLKGTSDLGIVYSFDDDSQPEGYTYSDLAGDKADRKSTMGFVFTFKGGPVAWKSKKQSVVAKSTAEAEYIALSFCASEALWVRNFFSEIKRPFGDSPITIHVDNQSAIDLAKDPVHLSKTKHIDIHVHHVRDEVAKGRILVEHVPGTANPADILTKPLDPTHKKCVALLRMH